MEEAVTQQHAHPNTVYHCLHAYYKLGYSKQHLAHIFNKCERTIRNWIKRYEENGEFQRNQTASKRTFSQEQVQWLFDFYLTNPLAYLDEAQAAFKKVYHTSISKSSVWRIIHEQGLTWKVLERRAMHIKEQDIYRFIEELSQVKWSHRNLVFLDEVSFDNRGMIRKRGYALRGKKVAIRGDFERKPRISVLAFINVDGVIDYFNAEGTFDRVLFTESCQRFVYSSRARLQMHPGRNSVWILDGASIHRDPEIVTYLRSVGVVPIFLPAYCPFFNPIEFMFGYMKRSFQRHYAESSKRDLLPFVIQTFRRFENFDMSKVYEHCGWSVQGTFNPIGPLSYDRRPAPQLDTGERSERNLDFEELDSVP